MIDDVEVRRIAGRLAVPEGQVRRDHLLSHLIQALAPEDRVVFIGGTALNRTHLPDLRLSEDLDLLVVEGSSDEFIARMLEGVRLEYPDISVVSRSHVHDVATYVLEGAGSRIQVQFIRERPEWTRLPAEPTQVRLRYPDLPDSIVLEVPTAAAFSSMKLAAFVDRAAPRDLFDLRALAEAGAITGESVTLTRRLVGRPLVKQEFGSAPTTDRWKLELSHQVAKLGTPEEAMAVVRGVLSDLIGW